MFAAMNAATSHPSVRINEIAFTGYPVTDLARARDFYEKVLGLTPATTFEHEGKGWIEYDIGASTLAITNTSTEQWKPSPDGPCVAFEVADFDSALQALRAAGVRLYVEPLEFPGCRFAVVGDPDGNSVAIHQRRAQG
jgi:predicted enzyme related to lactoylglutathione lyase